MSTLNTITDSIKNYFSMLYVGTTLIWEGLLEALNVHTNNTTNKKGDKWVQ